MEVVRPLSGIHLTPIGNMTSLTRYDSNGIELVIDNATGEAFATQKGYARMSGLSQQAVNKRCKGYNQNSLKSVETDLGYGLQGYNLIPAELVFEWLLDDNRELAKAMGKAGATVYMHQLAGYKVISSPIAPIDKLSRILDRPDPWQRFYDKDFCDRAFRWFGASFYWTYIYSQFTPEEACKINRLNPPVNGIRPDKIHQYINKDIKARLTPYIRELVACLDGAPTRDDFEIGYARHFGGNDQLRLPKM
jgi:hypothetical protein